MGQEGGIPVDDAVKIITQAKKLSANPSRWIVLLSHAVSLCIPLLSAAV